MKSHIISINMWRHLVLRFLNGPGLRRCSSKLPATTTAVSFPEIKEERQLDFKKIPSSTLKAIPDQNGPDVFGNLPDLLPGLKKGSGLILPSSLGEDLDDGDGEEDYHKKRTDPNRPYPLDMMNNIVDLLEPPDVNLKEALEVFEVDMKKDIIRPIPQMFRLLIHACGRQGYTDKAFELYRHYRDRNFPHNYGMYADLFNAIANAPDDGNIKVRALRNARRLHEHLQNETKVIPITVYNTMIKAFGNLGDLETAFHLADDMSTKYGHLSPSTVAHCLQACIGDKEAGFRHALIFWRNIRKMKGRLDVVCYNSMLKIVRDCGAGDPRLLHDLLIESMSGKEVRKMRAKQLEGKNPEENEVPWYQMDLKELQILDDKKVAKKNRLPCLLDPEPNFEDSSIVGLSPQGLDRAEDRLILLGGADGFLDCLINADHLKPDVKIFSQLLDLSESSEEAETKILERMKAEGVAPDVDIFNQIMVRRVKRKDFRMARQVMDDLAAHGLTPTLATFKYLASTCTTKSRILSYLRQLGGLGFRPNIQIMTVLTTSGIFEHDPEMVMLTLKLMTQKYHLKPDKHLLQKVERFYQKYRQILIDLERGKEIHYVPKYHLRRISNKFKENDLEDWREFVSFYNQWLSSVSVDPTPHPWKQFMTSRDYEKLGKKGR